MDWIRQWALGVAGAAMIGAAVLAVTPPGAVKKVVRIGAALLLAVAALQPLTGWNLTVPEFPQTPAEEKNGQELLGTIIEEKTAAYIVNKAQAVGLVVSVTAQCRMGEFYPQPWSVTIRSERPEHAMNALAATIEGDLGIPLERQIYREAAP